MMVFFPIGQESTIRRWPVVTVWLIGIMAAIQIYNEFTIKSQKRDYTRAQRSYSTQYEEIKKVYYRKYSPEITGADTDEDVRIINEFTREAPERIRELLASGDLIPLDSDQYRELQKADAAVARTKQKFLWVHLGFVPNNPNPWSWITNIFVHGNLLHFLGNIIFFWFVGCNMEDRWGRLMYLFFFFAGGIAANFAHLITNIYSSEPAIGASGAIAALMGAFLIRFPCVPTRLFWVWFGFTFRYGIITVPAYAGLIVWFIFQLILVTFHIGHIAFWAHIGGFLFGAGFTILLMMTGIDRRLNRQMEHKVENLEFKTEYEITPEFQSALIAESRGDTDKAVRILKKESLRNPEHIELREVLGRLLMKQGRIHLGTIHLTKSVEADLTAGEIDSAVDTVQRILHAGGAKHIPGQSFEKILESLGKHNRSDIAKKLEKQAT
jgi:membrane associated rhomboid family serine protease